MQNTLREMDEEKHDLLAAIDDQISRMFKKNQSRLELMIQDSQEESEQQSTYISQLSDMNEEQINQMKSDHLTFALLQQDSADKILNMVEDHQQVIKW